MDKLRVSVLFWEEREQGTARRDEVVAQVASALAELGHKVSFIGINEDLRELMDRLDEKHPDLVFNICERFAERDDFETHITAVLEMLGQPFTGSGLVGMTLRQDKTIAKKLLKFQEIPYPNFATVEKNSLEFAGRMHFPLFVKPLQSDASLGIDDSSLVTSFDKLVERINFIQTQLKQAALVEEYIEGREFYVGILGNDPAEVLPVIELDYKGLPPQYPRIYGYSAKSDISSVQYGAINFMVATELTPETRNRLVITAREAAYALKMLDYSRVDIRLTPDGIPVVIEVNANPYLERTSAFAVAALQAGMGYTNLIKRIVESAWKRYEQTPWMKEMQKGRSERVRMRRRMEKLIQSCEEDRQEVEKAPDSLSSGESG